jgi:hypothetical protein
MLFLLKATSNDYPRYRLTWQAAGDRTIRTVTVRATRLLNSGEYVLSLSGLNPDGEADALSKTIFLVEKNNPSQFFCDMSGNPQPPVSERNNFCAGFNTYPGDFYDDSISVGIAMPLSGYRYFSARPKRNFGTQHHAR